MSGSPAGRVLALLERVQERPGLTAPRLADELGVSERTVRRYVTTLHDLGIPIEAGRGKVGGHRLRSGCHRSCSPPTKPWRSAWRWR